MWNIHSIYHFYHLSTKGCRAGRVFFWTSFQADSPPKNATSESPWDLLLPESKLAKNRWPLFWTHGALQRLKRNKNKVWSVACGQFWTWGMRVVPSKSHECCSFGCADLRSILFALTMDFSLKINKYRTWISNLNTIFCDLLVAYTNECSWPSLILLIPPYHQTFSSLRTGEDVQIFTSYI